ncbi:MAG: baseplate J/gp47 family protein [Anaerolineales bacterium]|nr:baseplate J/gp47 family protein [Anaerolineales bacterium]
MKTQIITLESHDDLISVRDKFSWAKTPRILLVWPKYEKVTLRLLDLKVLQRHADSLGAQLGLVTRRANVRRDAESLGIPVFASTTTAQKDLWPKNISRSQRIPKVPRRDLRQVRDTVYEKEASWRISLLGRVITFTAGVIAVLIVAGLFVPSATLTLYPQSQTQSVVIPVSASESVDSVSVTGVIPARPLSVKVNAEQSLTVRSVIAIPKIKSKGIVRFTNLGQGEVEIPTGTVVVTESSIRFVTLHNTRLLAGVDEFVDVPIEAMELGTQGNVLADTITIVEGPLGLSISVTNPNAITGGVDARLIGADEDDRANLREMVMESLQREAASKLSSQIAPDDILLSDTFEVVEIIEENFEPPAGQPGETLILKMQVEYSARTISAEDMNQLSLAALDSSITDGFEPFGDANFKPLTEPITDSSGVTHFELDVTRTLLQKVDFTQVFSFVRGSDPKQAEEQLTENFSLRQESDIVLTPSWWPWLPLIPFNISVEVR